MVSRFDILKEVPYLKVWDEISFSREGTFTLWGNVSNALLALADLFQPMSIEVNEDGCVYMLHGGYFLALDMKNGTWEIEEEI